MGGEKNEAGAKVGGRCTGALQGRAQPGCVMLTVLLLLPGPSPWTENGKRREKRLRGPHWCGTQREVMSLSALSSSSLMALYFIFCA